MKNYWMRIIDVMILSVWFAKVAIVKRVITLINGTKYHENKA